MRRNTGGALEASAHIHTGSRGQGARGVTEEPGNASCIRARAEPRRGAGGDAALDAGSLRGGDARRSPIDKRRRHSGHEHEGVTEFRNTTMETSFRTIVQPKLSKFLVSLLRIEALCSC